MTRAGKSLVQIRFPDSTQYFPENEIEPSSLNKEHPLDLLELGRLGRASDLRRLLTHVKLSGKLANLLYSMEVTNSDFYAYQFKPVLKMLSSVSNGIIIADEVGLGKTIEAGLIWTELRSRFDFGRLMVLCPAPLREKWRRELSNRFGIEAEVQDAQMVHSTLKEAARIGGSAKFSIIGSLQGLRPQRGWDDELEADKRPSSLLAQLLQKHQHDSPLIDLLIVDEAHYLRISDLKNPDKKTTVLGRLLRGVAEHVVLLSATPIHLRNLDLYQLLNIVDDATFNQPLVFDEILNANAPLLKAREEVIRRCVTVEEFKSLITQALDNPLLQGNRQLSALIETPPSESELKDPKIRSEIAYRLETINLLGHVVTRTRKRDVIEWRVIRQAIPEPVPMTPVEEQFYNDVTEAVREFCQDFSKSEGFILTTPQRQMSSSMPAALREWERKYEAFDEELYEDLGREIDPEIPRVPVVAQLISKVKSFGNLDDLWRSDSKYKRLRSILTELVRQNNREKIVLFSFFRATLDYLSERLAQDGVSNIVLKGNSIQPKDDIIDDFTRLEGPNVLLSSEVGSEGIDLQFSHVLINYDLPWNPMRVEQRIGRIDRLGQTSPKVLIWNLYYADTIDAKIYERLHNRLRIFEHALGGLEPILGEQVQQLTLDLLIGKLTPSQETDRIEQTAQALVNIRQQEESLEKDAAHLVAHGDYILNQVKAAKELHRWVTGLDIQIYVSDFFHLYYPGCRFLSVDRTKNEFEVSLTNQAKLDLETFIRQRKVGGITQFTRNDPQPVRCRFENKITAEKGRQIEIVNQVHSLVRFVGDKIDSQTEHNHPAVSIRLSKESSLSSLKEGVYVFTIQHWTIEGLQQVERLYYAAIRLDDPNSPIPEAEAEKLITGAASNGSDWIEAINVLDLNEVKTLANEKCLLLSDGQFDAFVLDIQNQNEDRADLQEKTLDLHLQNQLMQLDSIKGKHASMSRASLVKATEGRISALQSRFEIMKIKVKQRRRIVSEKREICVGVILFN